MNNPPKITIILTTFNRAHLIGETLDSIIAQTHQNWECIIIDDNSTDNTNELIKKILLKEKRFSFFIKGNKYAKGLSASRNMGMDLVSQTDFLQFFDDDDIMHPQKFEFQIAEFNKNKDLDLVIFPTLNFFKKNELKISYYNTYKSNLIDNIAEDFILGKTIFTAQVPLFKYNYIKEVRFDEQLFYAEEWEVFCKLFFNKITHTSYINKPLYYHRKHNMSITSNLYSDASIKEISKYKAFVNVYQSINKSNKFSNQIFNRFITFAIHQKNTAFFNMIKEDLRKGILNNKYKERLILFLFTLNLHSFKVGVKLIHKISRW